MVPCDVLVPRAKGVFTSPDGGVAQLGATVAATVTAVTTPASPTPSSVLLTVRFMPSSRPRLACIGDVGDKDAMAFQPKASGTKFSIGSATSIPHVSTGSHHHRGRLAGPSRTSINRIGP